jgi:hypothetical protein
VEQINSIVNLKDAINVYETLDPIQHVTVDNDDTTVVTSNKCQDIACNTIAATTKTMSFATTHAVADTGGTSLFVMEGLKMNNVQIATHPLSINLPDNAIVKSTHTCDIVMS